MKQLLSAVGILCAVMSIAAEGKTPKVKQPKPPTQEDITQGCVTVSDIHSRSLNLFSGVLTPEPGLDAKVYNGCGQTAHVYLTIAYLQKNGGQFGNGMESLTVAPGATYQVQHQAMLMSYQRGALKWAKIIAVEGYLAR